jgi:UDP-glucose 4-epimerase
MRVLVTGAGGYIGRAVIEALAASGHEPVALWHRHRAQLADGIEHRQGDLLAPGSILAALAGIDAVCHLAAISNGRESFERPVPYFQVNSSGTFALLEAMATADVRQLVFASTASIYGTPERQPMNEDLPDRPPHPYAASKAAAEAAIGWQARTGALGAIVLRIFNAAGGNDPDPGRLLPRVLRVAAGEAPSLTVNGDGTVVRDYLHVADAAAAFVAALGNGVDVGTAHRYNIGSGVGSSVMDIVAAVERVVGKTLNVVHRVAAAEPAALICDPSRAIAELGWKPHRSNLDAIVADAWAARPAQAI